MYVYQEANGRFKVMGLKRWFGGYSNLFVIVIDWNLDTSTQLKGQESSACLQPQLGAWWKPEGYWVLLASSLAKKTSTLGLWIESRPKRNK